MEKIAAGAYLEHGRLHHLTMQERYYAHRGTHILTELWLCQPVLGVLKTLFLCPVFVSEDFWVISEQETLHHGMVLGKLSEQLQLVDFIPGGARSTMCRMLIQTCAGLPLIEGRQKYLQQLSASEYTERKAAENSATKYYNQLFKKKI